ncbi:DUF397 domain-containing protein [Streptomyces griseus]|uniref:DUF397 domain-containing protein n=1 Tax=Streptomyces griseus TaxID=1911 RepID=UPI0038156F57
MPTWRRAWPEAGIQEGQKGTGSGEFFVATCPHTVHVRDSKDLTVPALALSPDAWTSFMEFAAS